MDGNYEITDLNVTGAGKIMKMKVNGKEVDVVTDITRNADKEITAISINGVAQDIAGGGGGETIPTEWHIWKTGVDFYVLLPFDDATDITDLEAFEALKVAIMNDAAQIEIMDLTDFEGFNDLSSFTADSAGQFTVENNGVEDVYKIGSAYTQIVDLDTNSNRTIDVSQYTGPVTITPEEGKNALENVRLTLTNIPSGGGTAYAWSTSGSNTNGWMYTNFDVAPDTEEEWFSKLVLDMSQAGLLDKIHPTGMPYTYTKTDDNTFVLVNPNAGNYTLTCTRVSNADLTLW